MPRMTQIPTPDIMPDYHFLFLAPNVEARWLFGAARAYVERFQPTVISNAVLLGFLPETATVTVSLLTRRDAFRALAVAIARERPTAYVDALIYEAETEAALALSRRATENQPFGVPLMPTPTPEPRFPITPTPGAVIGGDPAPPDQNANPSGFITMTPSPTPPADALPDTNDDDDRLSPTPGAITGG